MDFRERFQAAARKALAEYEDYAGKEDPTDAFIFAITEAASDWANAHGDQRYSDGRFDENLSTADF